MKLISTVLLLTGMTSCAVCGEDPGAASCLIGHWLAAARGEASPATFAGLDWLNATFE
jgi:hypothetical protein